MFPFHTWLPDAHVEAPTAGSVILAGVLLKMGTYGFIRFSLPLFPQATLAAVPWVVALSIIGIVYAALVTLVQKDMKKLIAYSSVSHLGFVMLGMFALNPLGLEGSVLQMVNHGLSTGGLFLIVGLIYERRHTKEIAQFGGLAHVMPVYATFTLIIFLASMGLPLLNGFVGEFMILQGAFAANRVWAYWAVSGVVLGAAYLLWLYQRVFWGKITHEENERLHDLNAPRAGDARPARRALLLDRHLPEALPRLPARPGRPRRGASSSPRSSRSRRRRRRRRPSRQRPSRQHPNRRDARGPGGRCAFPPAGGLGDGAPQNMEARVSPALSRPARCRRASPSVSIRFPFASDRPIR